MKLTEIAGVGKECLAEYESRLKVHGVRRFDWDAKDIKQRVDVNIDRLTGPEDIKPAVLSVLDRLAAIDGFKMSEPKYTELPCIELENVAHNDLCLSFSYGWSIADSESYLWIACWYFPSA